MPISQNPQLMMEQSTAHVLDHRGTPLHYWLNGPENAPVIICTHGATVDHRMFARQLPLLATQYRVITWDVRGHGLSRPMGDSFSISQCMEDLLAILDALGISRATFLGHSMGGNIAQEVAYHYGQRVEALIILDSECNTGQLTRWERWTLRLTPTLLALYPYALLKHQAAKASALKREVQEYIYAASSLLTKAEYNTILVETARCLHEDRQYHVTQPLLLLLGDHDHLGSIASSMPAWSKRETLSRFWIVPYAGHCSNQDNPDAVNQHLMDFLQSVFPARPR